MSRPDGADATPVTLALPKGRMLGDVVALFGRAGYDLGPLLRPGRRLIFAFPAYGLRVILVRDLDVPTYVDYGAADVGVAGRDVIEEHGFDLYEPLDLGIGRCRLAIAEPADRPVDERTHLHLRIATTYPRITRRYLDRQGRSAEIIKLYGSVELGPDSGLCDRVVDLVATGETLRQHRLRELETVMEVTARLVVNRASLKLRRAPLDRLCTDLRAALRRDRADARGGRAARRGRR